MVAGYRGQHVREHLMSMGKYARGFEAGQKDGGSWGCGCLFGFVLAFVMIYMGWCSPYPFGQ